MSIPLVQNNEKDSINTSIIAIKRNIERINMLLGLSNSEEIDTSEFVKKSDIVDEVTLGNMQSVSSDAVAKSLSIEKVYTYSSKLIVTKPKNIDMYIFTLYGATVNRIGNAINELGITTQNVQVCLVSRRDVNNNNVYPCTVVLNTNGTVGAWYAVNGAEWTIASNDILYGQFIIYKN